MRVCIQRTCRYFLFRLSFRPRSWKSLAANKRLGNENRKKNITRGTLVHNILHNLTSTNVEIPGRKRSSVPRTVRSTSTSSRRGPRSLAGYYDRRGSADVITEKSLRRRRVKIPRSIWTSKSKARETYAKKPLRWQIVIGRRRNRNHRWINTTDYLKRACAARYDACSMTTTRNRHGEKPVVITGSRTARRSCTACMYVYDTHTHTNALHVIFNIVMPCTLIRL